MRYLSVCSGIEAASVAWEPLGFVPVAFSEVAPFPAAVLSHRFPHVPNVGDMTNFEEWNIGPVDLLVGGTPCQSFSVAGLRGGLEDDRGNLALIYCRILQRYQPRWFVWENVPGVLSSNGGRDFGSILGAMAELGYGIAYRILDAQFFGVPQRRRRVFVVGCAGDWRRAAKVLFEPGCLCGDSSKGRKARQAVAALTANGVGTCGADDNQGQAGHLISSPITGRPYGDRGAGEDRLIAGTLGSNHGNVRADQSWTNQLIPSTGRLSHCLNAGGMGRQDYETETLIASAYRTAGDGAVYDEGDKTAPLTTSTDPNANVIAFAENSRSELRFEGGNGLRTGALSTGGGKAGQGRPTIAGTTGVRRLTPRECERLQGFPDDWTLIPYRGRPAADGPRYKSIGNSMAVPVMRWIGKRISASERLETAGCLPSDRQSNG